MEKEPKINSSEKIRKCSECGRKLSNYNQKGKCNFHGIDPDSKPDEYLEPSEIMPKGKQLYDDDAGSRGRRMNPHI